MTPELLLYIPDEITIVMEDYHEYELTALIDMLAERTATYTQMMSDGFNNGEEFAQTGEQILLIQKAIWVKMGFSSTEPNGQ